MGSIIKNILFSLRFKKGPVAEWLGKALQKLLQRFESARDLNIKWKDLLNFGRSFHFLRAVKNAKRALQRFIPKSLPFVYGFS
jgi:DNA topoisomerase IB